MEKECMTLIPLEPEDRQSTEILEAYKVQFILKNPEMFQDVFEHVGAKA